MSFDEFPNELVVEVSRFLSQLDRLRFRLTEKRANLVVKSLGRLRRIGPFRIITEFVAGERWDELGALIDWPVNCSNCRNCHVHRTPYKMRKLKNEWILREAVRMRKKQPIKMLRQSNWSPNDRAMIWVARVAHDREWMNYLLRKFGRSLPKFLENHYHAVGRFIRLGYSASELPECNLFDYAISAAVKIPSSPLVITLQQLQDPQWRPSAGNKSRSLPPNSSPEVIQWLLQENLIKRFTIGNWIEVICSGDQPLIDLARSKIPMTENDKAGIGQMAMGWSNIVALEWAVSEGCLGAIPDNVGGSPELYKWLMQHRHDEFTSWLSNPEHAWTYCSWVISAGDYGHFLRIFSLVDQCYYAALVHSANHSRQLKILRFVLGQLVSIADWRNVVLPKQSWLGITAGRGLAKIFKGAVRDGRYRGAKIIDRFTGPYAWPSDGFEWSRARNHESRHELWKILKHVGQSAE
jgi:hypothetical protein